LGELHTEAGLRIARQDLACSRRLLQIVLVLIVGRARSRFIGLLRPSLAGSVLSTTLFGFPVAIGAGNGAAALQKIAVTGAFLS
jgi:hypothetical protein